MSLDKTIMVLNDMVERSVISDYAIAGAVAALYYVEVRSTEDVDILVTFETPAGSTGLVLLTPILSYLASRGYSEFRHEGVVVEGWPVQFLPVASDLDAEALREAATIALQMPGSDEATPTRVLQPEHIVAKAVQLQRPVDLVRIAQFLDERIVDLDQLAKILERHGLQARWTQFCRATGRVDVLGDKIINP